MRDDMFRWLSGPGEVFKQPLPGSTNYLNAYDGSGNLLRARNEDLGRGNGSDQKQMENDEEDKDEEKFGNRSKPRNEKVGLPKEGAEDLVPFPMNRAFRSQAVLSEELKDAIWKRVMEDGKSVRDVSATLGVEMRRVAAVVRLKGVEKNWENQVCHTVCHPFACQTITDLFMMRKTSISLED